MNYNLTLHGIYKQQHQQYNYVRLSTLSTE